MESLNPELALYGSKNEFPRTNTVVFPISEVSTGAVSLVIQEPDIFCLEMVILSRSEGIV